MPEQTTINEARNAVQDRLLTWQAANYPAALVHFQNEAFEEPESGVVFRLAFRQIGGGQETLGATSDRRYWRTANILVEVWTAADGGMSEGDGIAEEVLDLFESTSFGGVHANDGRISEVAHDGKWNRHIVTVEVGYSETK